jgi:hypothetical protein
VLGPVLFLIFINDIVDVVTHSSLKIFADDTKIYFRTRKDSDFDRLAYDVRKVFGWAHKNKLTIAMSKCQVLHIGNGNCCRDLFIGDQCLPEKQQVRDLGVLVSSNLSFIGHINEIIVSTYRRSCLIFKCFLTREPNFLKQMFISFCRPKLEYNSCVWAPYLAQEITLIENVQRRFTKRIPGLQDKAYDERLRVLQLESLEQRRLIADLCMTFCICKGLNELKFNEFFTYARTRTTRGHAYKLSVQYARSNVRKHFFANRVVNVWNALPTVAVEAASLSAFKTAVRKLDLRHHLRFPEFAL